MYWRNLSLSDRAIYRTRLLVLLLIFIGLLVMVRIYWSQLYLSPNQPLAKQGVLELENYQIHDYNPILLNGEWTLYPMQLLTPADLAGEESSSSFIKVPGLWLSEMKEQPDFLASKEAYAYGTYRLRILVDKSEKNYTIRIHQPKGSTALYVNGVAYTDTGTPSNERSSMLIESSPIKATFTSNNGVIDVLIPFSGDTYWNGGGLSSSILFGTKRAVENAVYLTIGAQVMVCIVLLFHGFYAIMLYFMNFRRRAFIYFALCALCGVLAVMTNYDLLILSLTDTLANWIIHHNQLFFVLALMTLSSFFRYFWEAGQTNRHLLWINRYLLVFAIYSIAIPVTVQPALLSQLIALGALVLIPIWLLVLTFIQVQNDKERKGGTLLLLAVAALVLNSIGESMRIWLVEWLPTFFYPINLLCCFFLIAIFWIKKFLDASRQRLLLNEQLQLNTKQKDEFISNTSHELRNPLHGIILLAQQMQKQAEEQGDTAYQKDLGLLASIGMRLNRLLSDLLDMSLLKKQGFSLQIQDVSLHKLTTDLLEMLMFMRGSKPITFSQQIESDFPLVRADENRLMQVLFNLLHNALKYTFEGTITMRITQIGDEALIEVIDTGIGMNEQTIQSIFQPYEQGGQATEDLQHDGIGLGLAICKELVELHGSSLKVESVFGSGSIFSFSLPIANMSQIAPKETRSEPSAAYVYPEALVTNEYFLSERQSPKQEQYRPVVLAVDNDPISLRVLASILVNAGYDLHTVSNAKEAIQILDTRKWDLLISDVRMPLMSGYELTRYIRNHYSASELPVLLLTARNRPEDLYTGFRAGANDYVRKPINAQELLARTYALTEMHQLVEHRLRMEAAWLQAQIRPHFLFNTLNSITALSEIDLERMRRLVDVLGEYLRTSFNFQNINRFVLLEREIRLVESYLFIEKERFGERIQVEWSLTQQRHHPIKIPPLTLQPLVENALIHGILKRARGGKIHISLEDHKRSWYFQIEDDGVGIDEEQLPLLLNQDYSPAKGIGLINIHKRLIKLYGKGLTIKSSSEKGTVVSFSIPKHI